MNEATATGGADGNERITFESTRELKRAMKAARSIVGKGSDKYVCLRGCRLYAPAGHTQVQVLATDGRRMTRVRVDASRRRADRMLDHALHAEAVRQLAHTKAATVRIEPDADGTRVSEGGETAPWTLHPPAKAHSVATFEQVLSDVHPKASATLVRSRAVAAMRRMPPQSRGAACRLELGPQGVRAWASESAEPGDLLAGEIEIAGQVEGATPIVIGVIRDELAATLRTLTAARATLSVEGPNRALQLVTDDGLQTALLASARLIGRMPA